MVSLYSGSIVRPRLWLQLSTESTSRRLCLLFTSDPRGGSGSPCRIKAALPQLQAVGWSQKFTAGPMTSDFFFFFFSPLGAQGVDHGSPPHFLLADGLRLLPGGLSLHLIQRGPPPVNFWSHRLPPALPLQAAGHSLIYCLALS